MVFKERYFFIWQRVWNFHKKYSSVKTDEDWNEAVEEAGKIGNESKFSKDLILAVLSELEREDKQCRKERGSSA